MLFGVMLPRLCLIFAIGFVLPTWAQSPITYDSGRRIWILQTGESTYAFGANDRKQLQHLYWGGPLWRAEDLPVARQRRDISSFDPHEMLDNEEFPAWGGPRFYEPSLKLTRADGNRDVVLEYVSHQIEKDRLAVELKDIRDDLFVTLHYQVGPGILERHATIRNGTKQPVTVESAQSAVWYLPAGDGYRLSYLTGRWAAETQLTREPLHAGGQRVLESRKGHTSHNVNPWFALDTNGAADEEHGDVWFGALGWSGNWRITVEQTPYQQVRVTGGLNPFDFAYQLKPGETLDTPPFYGGYSGRGFGHASRLLHRFERTQILPGGESARQRPVLYNSWEATEFHVNEEGQKQLAEKAAKIGVELFVMDDGWFGKRNNDRAGLGDWFVNPQKFPQGLDPLIRYVNGLGMDFGLWVEPEMVNPDSDLYRQHPDWVMNFPGRPRSELRNQLVLNLARNDVKEYLFGVLDKLATTYPIRYFKWDMNRPFAEPGWPEAAVGEQRHLWVQYVRNLYEIIDRLRAKHPKLEIESCSGGGGRVDLGILRRVEEVWTSDNTEAFDRLRIQEGFTQAYAPKVMSAWVTDVPNMNGRSTPLQYRFLVAMQGALGIGANLNKWTADDFGLATKLIAYDKQIRKTVQEGDLYRLFSPREGDLTANEYVAADGKQAVLFAFRHAQQYNTMVPAIRLSGLEEKAVYRLTPLAPNQLTETSSTLSGAYLMQHGLQLRLTGDYASTSVLLERVGQ